MQLILSSYLLDQIRTVDKTRLVKKLGAINSEEQKAILSILVEMFSEDWVKKWLCTVSDDREALTFIDRQPRY